MGGYDMGLGDTSLALLRVGERERGAGVCLLTLVHHGNAAEEPWRGRPSRRSAVVGTLSSKVKAIG
jgi:hypothetical protein